MRLLMVLMAIIFWQTSFARISKADKVVLKYFVEIIGIKNCSTLRISKFTASIHHKRVALKGIKVSIGTKNGFLFWSKFNCQVADASDLSKCIFGLILLDEKGDTTNYLVMESEEGYCIYRLNSSGKIKWKKLFTKN